MKTSYRTNLTDEQWEIIKTLIPEAKPGGRPRNGRLEVLRQPQNSRPPVDMREIINGIFYILVAGYHKGTMCAWYLLPHDFPTARFCKLRKPQHISRSKWKTVYHYFRQWRIDGDWQRIHEQLRQWVRAIEDRHPSKECSNS